MASPLDRGQAVPLLTLVLLVAVAVLLVVVEVTVGATWRAQASAAADAAALAGAVEGEAGARRLVEANGAELVSFARLDGGRVRVVVRRREATASATAERTGGDGGVLAPVMAAAVARAEQLLGRRVPYTSGEGGLTIDVDPAVLDALLAVAPQAGLCRSAPDSHPVHFEPCPSTRRRTTPRSALASVVPVATAGRVRPAVRRRWRHPRAPRPTCGRAPVPRSPTAGR